MLRKNNLLLGIILGFLTPFLGLVIHYFLAFYKLDLAFTDFLLLLKQNTSLLTAVTSLSLLANAAVFTIYLNYHKDTTAKGIFLATLIYGIGVLLVKVIR